MTSSALGNAKTNAEKLILPIFEENDGIFVFWLVFFLQTNFNFLASEF